MIIAVLLTRAKTWKPPKCPLTDEWIQKMLYIDTTEYYSAVKKKKEKKEKNEIMPFEARQLELEIIIPSEVSQKGKDKQHMISLTCEI